MAHDGLKPTGKYFEGTRYIGQAHYPLITDYVEQSLGTLDEARAFMAEHSAKGANVQVHEHKWTERFVAFGWQPAAQFKTEA